VNNVFDEELSRRVGRGVLGFLFGLMLSLSVVWASGLGMDDREQATRVLALDLSAACAKRDGPDTLAYYDGSATPPGWYCAATRLEEWSGRPIRPDEACRLLHGGRSRARLASGANPFAWECRL
jgi:hypothetical protein